VSRQSESGRGKSTAVKNDVARTSAAAAASTSVADEGEMNSLLSQYLAAPANDSGVQPTGTAET